MALQQKRGLLVRELGRLSDTRWACHFRNTAVIRDRYDVIIDIVCSCQELKDSDIIVHGRGLLCQVKTFHFVSITVILHRVPSITHGVNETLQLLMLNVAGSALTIKSMISVLTKLRNDEWAEPG